MNLLKEIYITHSPTGEEGEIISLIKRKCEKIGAQIHTDDIGNLYVTKGVSNTYPCVVTSIDQVKRRECKFTTRQSVRADFVFGWYVSAGTTKTFERSNIGSDTKNGIWCALKLLESCDIIKCVFFVQSRNGFVGAHYADMSFFDNARFVLQANNSGGKSIAIRMKFCDLANEQFLRDINHKEFNYNSVGVGLASDVYELYIRGLKVASCNISNGSHYPETILEYSNLTELQKCLHFMEHIVRTCKRVYEIENNSLPDPDEINDELDWINSIEF